MDKAPMEVMEGSAITREAPVAIDKNQAPDESDPPAGVNGKYRLNDDYVSSILAMPSETTPCEIPFLQGDNLNLAELMGVTEEWLQDRRQRYKEATARSQRISNDFELFQEKVRRKLLDKGYVEVDDQYLDGVAELQEYSKKLCKDKRNMV